MSKTKGGGSTRNGRDSNAQRLGVKVFDGGARHGRFDHRAPAGHPVPPGHGRRAGQRRHAVRAGRTGTSTSPTATGGAWWTSSPSLRPATDARGRARSRTRW